MTRNERSASAALNALLLHNVADAADSPTSFAWPADTVRLSLMLPCRCCSVANCVLFPALLGYWRHVCGGQFDASVAQVHLRTVLLFHKSNFFFLYTKTSNRADSKSSTVTYTFFFTRYWWRD